MSLLPHTSHGLHLNVTHQLFTETAEGAPAYLNSRPWQLRWFHPVSPSPSVHPAPTATAQEAFTDGSALCPLSHCPSIPHCPQSRRLSLTLDLCHAPSSPSLTFTLIIFHSAESCSQRESNVSGSNSELEARKTLSHFWVCHTVCKLHDLKYLPSCP